MTVHPGDISGPGGAASPHPTESPSYSYPTAEQAPGSMAPSMPQGEHSTAPPGPGAGDFQPGGDVLTVPKGPGGF